MDCEVTIFTGVARSGTTMLGAIAKNELDVAAVNEGSFELWLADRFPRDELPGDEADLRRALNEFVKHVYFRILLNSSQAAALGMTPEKAVDRLLELTSPRTVQGLGIAVLRLTSEVLQLPRLGHEDPLLMTNLRKLLRVFPQAKIVHIVRDPRDVAASILQFPWGPNNVAVAALQWANLVRTTRSIGRELGLDRYLEVRYQNFLQTPREELSKLMTFVCGAVDETRLERFVAQAEANPLRNNVETWRQSLTPIQLRRIESACGEQMTEFGFVRATDAPPMSAAERCCWKAHNRWMQLLQIGRGHLRWNGEAIFESGPNRKTAEKLQRLRREAVADQQAKS